MLQINWAEKAAITHYATFSAQKYSVIFRPYYASYIVGYYLDVLFPPRSVGPAFPVTLAALIPAFEGFFLSFAIYIPPVSSDYKRKVYFSEENTYIAWANKRKIFISENFINKYIAKI